jgi:hypothetical protein
MERCEQYWLEHLEPTLLDQPSEPAPPLAAVPAAGEPVPELDPPPGLLKLNPTKGRPANYWHGGWRDTTPPSTKFIASLHERGCTVIPHPTNPDRWGAQCPAHEDRSPSLSIERKPDGMLLVHCFAGCDIGDVTNALGLEVRDLWAGNELDHDRLDGPPRKVVPAHLRHAMRQLIDLADGHRTARRPHAAPLRCAHRSGMGETPYQVGSSLTQRTVGVTSTSG